MAAVTAACGSSSTGREAAATGAVKSVTLDGARIPVDGPLKLAVFLPGTYNADLPSRVKELHRRIDAKRTSRAAGAPHRRVGLGCP